MAEAESTKATLPLTFSQGAPAVGPVPAPLASRVTRYFFSFFEGKVGLCNFIFSYLINNLLVCSVCASRL